MKYFTPDLLARFGSPDDAVADAAQAEWEQASTLYRSELERMQNRLPQAFTKMLDAVPLHDAKVAVMRRQGGMFLLDLATTDGQRCSFCYKLPQADRIELDDNQGKESYWLYDEVEFVESSGTCVHHVLLADGRERAIPFVDFSYATVVPTAGETSVRSA